MYILSLSFSSRSQVHDLVPQHKKLLSWKQLRMPTWQQLTFKPGGTPCLLPSPTKTPCYSRGQICSVSSLAGLGCVLLWGGGAVGSSPTWHHCTPKTALVKQHLTLQLRRVSFAFNAYWDVIKGRGDHQFNGQNRESLTVPLNPLFSECQRISVFLEENHFSTLHFRFLHVKWG